MRLIAHRGFIRDKEVVLSGQVVHADIRQPKDSDSLFTNAFAMVRRFLARSVRGKPVVVYYDDSKKTVLTDKHGGFEASFPLGESTTARVRAGGQVRVVDVFLDTPGINVVSDVDDTFLVSYINSFFRRAYVAFTKNALTRKPVTGMKRLYGPVKGNIFYVSDSPWRLYDLLELFQEHHGFPKGPLLLRRRSKYARIESLLEAYAGAFILVGDDGQKDPEIYARIFERHKKRIRGICLRHVASEKRRKQVERLLAGAPFVLSEDVSRFKRFF